MMKIMMLLPIIMIVFEMLIFDLCYSGEDDDKIDGPKDDASFAS